MKIQEFFRLGMDRELPTLLDFPEGVVLNVGAGNKHIPGAVSLDLPDWDANVQPLPYVSDSVAGIHAYNFLEHVERPIDVLAEFQRVLKVDGVLNVVVPHYRCQGAYHDITHQSWWSEDTWKTLFWNRYFKTSRYEWRWRLHANFIIGLNENNLALCTQLVKT